MLPAILVAALACRSPTPDLVVISVDTLRADRLGFMGHTGAHTPNFDALAARGYTFRQATTPLPRTTPALGSLQTGLRPAHHGAREVGERVRAEGRLAGWLGAAGWQTAAITAISVAGPDQGLDLGFGAFRVDHDAPGPDIARQAVELARAFDPERPAYLWVHLADPHFPYLPHPSGPLQPDAPKCRAVAEKAAAGALRRVDLFANRGGRAAAIVEQCAQLYDAEIAVADQAVGALLDALDEVRDRPRLVVFTADHGENLGEDGLYFEHGPSLHDADVRVPLVLAGPGVPRGADDGVARLEDVVPTVLELLGQAVPSGLDGVSLAGRMRGGTGGPVSPAPGPEVALIEAGSALQIRLFGWPVSGRAAHWCWNEAPLSWCTRADPPGSGLFDHVADPGLAHDLAADRPEDAARLSAAARTVTAPERTRHRRIRTPDRSLLAAPSAEGWALTPAGDDPADPLRVALDAFEVELGSTVAAPVPPPTTEEALRALGYVE